MDTNRRDVLRWAGSGIAVAFAGCNATSSDSNGNRPTATGRNTPARTTDSNPAPETEGPAEILASDFKRVQTTIPPDNVVWGKLKNTGKQYITTLEVEAIFRTKADRIIGTPTASIEGLEPGGVWKPYVPSFETPTQVATGELAIKEVITGPPPEKPDAAAVIEDSLHLPHEFKQPAAAGEVENTGEETIDFTIHAGFYATDDVLLDTGALEVTGLDPEEVREFHIEFAGYEVLAAPQVASYAVSLIR